jgi:hypothetical protein
MLLGGVPSWEGLEDQAFFPAKVADKFDPGEDMKQVLYHFYQTAEGRKHHRLAGRPDGAGALPACRGEQGCRRYRRRQA